MPVYVRERGTIARRKYVQLTGMTQRMATRDLADLVAEKLIQVLEVRG